MNWSKRRYVPSQPRMVVRFLLCRGRNDYRRDSPTRLVGEGVLIAIHFVIAYHVHEGRFSSGRNVKVNFSLLRVQHERTILDYNRSAPG